MSDSKAVARALFEGPSPRVRTAPPGIGFLDLLADWLIAELESADNSFALADALILTQNRRTARALIEVFSERGHAMLLPAIRPLADVEDDADVWGADPIALNVPPAIDDLRRRLELAQLIRKKDEAEGGVGDPAGAIAAADELCRLLDAASAAERVDWNALPDLVEHRDLAQHWERSAKFLEIIAQFWPQRLQAERLADPAERRTLLLNALAESWTKRAPQGPVVIAGSTGSVAAVRRLMGVVAGLPRGCVILPGLDSDLDDEAWNEIEASHPQHGLKVTLEKLELDRRNVPVLLGAEETKRATARRVLVREALAPAGRTADWLQRLEHAARPWGERQAFVQEACAGLSLIEAQNEEEEATTIALLLRQALETPGRTAALVTPDTRLGQRVAAKLTRWGVAASPSAGTALADAQAGVLLTLLAELTEDEGLPVSLAALLKHPLARFGSPREISAFESEALRGPRRHRDLAHLKTLLEADEKTRNHIPLLEKIAHALAPLREIFSDGHAEASELANALNEAAWRVAGEGAMAGRAGQSAALFLQSLADAKGALGEIAPAQAPRLIATLLAGRVAQAEADTHPRLAIWGPLEARLQRRDLVILGGLNEGTWPAPPPDDPFLSRSLRAALGLGDAESRIGLAAHDFAQLANADEVVLTRAMRAGGAPTVASRWIWRLDTLVKAAEFNLRRPEPLAWARALDKPASITPARAPRPTPARHGKFLTHLSVTDVEKLIRDPYAVYAKRILGLERRRPIGAPVDPRDLGNAIHKALEVFAPSEAPADEQIAELLTLLDAQFLLFGYSDEMRAALRSRLKGAASDFVAWACGRVAAGVTPYLEKFGTLDVDGVMLTGRADRIELAANGRAEIIDFKTGAPPTNKQVNSGLAPQLLLEAAMLRAAAFPDVPAAETDALVYWRFAGTRWGPRPVVLSSGDAEAAAKHSLAGLKHLLAHYASPEAAFLSKPRVEFLNDVDDYDHLARRKEWAATEEKF